MKKSHFGIITLGCLLAFGNIACSDTPIKDLPPEDVRRLAAEGNAEAQYELGDRCLYGRDGEKQQTAQAIEWLRKAVRQNNARAQLMLGICTFGGVGVKQSTSEGIALIEKAANQGNAEAQNMLGEFYSDGRGVPMSETKAFAWFMKAAEQDYALAQLHLTSCYKNGEGVEVSQKESEKWFRRAIKSLIRDAENGDKDAQYKLYQHYGDKQSRQYSEEKSMGWLKKSAENGNHDAEFLLGMAYLRGAKSLPMNPKKAYYWLVRSADGGNGDAQYSTGACLYHGVGTDKNLTEAFRYYRSAAYTLEKTDILRLIISLGLGKDFDATAESNRVMMNNILRKAYAEFFD